MSLFDFDREQNLLPYDGTVNYYGKIMAQQEADRYTDILLNIIEWKNDEALIFGKHIITKRKALFH